MDMSEQGGVDRVWDLIEKVGVCMLTTQSAGRLRARPVEARPERKICLIFVVTDVRSAKPDEIEANPDICLAFVDPKAKAYLSIAARARVTRDTAKIEQVWRITDTAWWPGGPTDPNVCLLRIEPQIAELWDGPSSTAATIFELAKALLTESEPALGENRKVTVGM
jgi:general stress protein 26